MTEIRQASTDTAQRALTLHGTAAQIAVAEWLFNELDRPTNPQALAQESQVTHEYRVSASGDDLVRVFYPMRTETPRDVQEVAKLVRSTAGIRWLFIYNAPRVLAMRGRAEQIALADRLIKERDR
jgi:hypothetical protein